MKRLWAADRLMGGLLKSLSDYAVHTNKFELSQQQGKTRYRAQRGRQTDPTPLTEYVLRRVERIRM